MKRKIILAVVQRADHVELLTRDKDGTLLRLTITDTKEVWLLDQALLTARRHARRDLLLKQRQQLLKLPKKKISSAPAGESKQPTDAGASENSNLERK